MYADCKSCGKSISGIYYSNCGEKVVTPNERTLSFQLGKIVNAITFADTKMLQTLWLVILKPGMLSREYMIGRRVICSAPLALFFIGNLIYFLLPILQTFNTSLDVQMNGMPYSSMVTNAVERKLEKESLGLDSYTEDFDAVSTSNAKLLLILIAIFMTPAFAIL